MVTESSYLDLGNNVRLNGISLTRRPTAICSTSVLALVPYLQFIVLISANAMSGIVSLALFRMGRSIILTTPSMVLVRVKRLFFLSWNSDIRYLSLAHSIHGFLSPALIQCATYFVISAWTAAFTDRSCICGYIIAPCLVSLNISLSPPMWKMFQVIFHSVVVYINITYLYHGICRPYAASR